MQKILTLVVLLSFVCFGSALKVIDNNANKTLACCGSSNSYDTTKQICCINTVYSIPTATSDLQAVCCGSHLLTTSQQCCYATAGEVSTNDRAIDSTAQCCGTNALTSTATQQCCDDSVVSLTSTLTTCCGNKAYNPTSDLCCGTTVISGAVGKECCSNSAYSPATQQCCIDKVQTNSGTCCGSTTYDSATQTCCADTVSSGASLSCCGTKGYDASTQTCCTDGDTFTVSSNSNGENTACCGTKAYNPSTQTCCSVSTDSYVKSGAVDSNDCPIYTLETTITYTLNSVASGDCCANTGIAYDPSTSLCCIDKVIKNTNNEECCGRSLYDPSTDLCCPDVSDANAKVASGRATDGYECCSTSSYDPTTNSCPCGVVISQSNDLTITNTNPNVSPACCGATQYDSNNKLCCSSTYGNYLFNLDPAAGLTCCVQDGKTIHNPGYQICCSKTKCSKPSTSTTTGTTTPSSASNSPSQTKDLVQCGDSCCNGVGYFKNFQKCCDNEIIDYNNDLASALTNPLACCGNDIYNTIYESCCTETTSNGDVNTAVYGGIGDWQLCCTSTN